jgi:hypothetical protein
MKGLEGIKYKRKFFQTEKALYKEGFFKKIYWKIEGDYGKKTGTMAEFWKGIFHNISGCCFCTSSLEYFNPLFWHHLMKFFFSRGVGGCPRPCWAGCVCMKNEVVRTVWISHSWPLTGFYCSPGAVRETATRRCRWGAACTLKKKKK